MRPITVSTSDASSADVESDWVFFDAYAFAPISIQVSVTDSATYTVYSTLDDPNDPTNPVAEGDMVWVAASTALTDANSSLQGSFTSIPKYAKIVQTDGTGSCRATFIQPANVPF